MIEVPSHIATLSESEVKDRILQIKKKRSSSLMILGHHYQRHGIIDIADEIGDSFGLAKAAAESKDCQYIVFCGVKFMAESAAILCREDQKVYHPEPEAGCAMADMAPMESVEAAWTVIESKLAALQRKIVPVTYMNSHAPLKAFTGEKDGAICTSSNAAQVMEWAWKKADTLLFFPDEKLGRNTAHQMGLSEEEMCIWYPSKKDGGLPEDLSKIKLILWNGHCPIHMKFTARDVHFIRKHFPAAKVIVHPECDKDVVDLADAVGSTSYIVSYVEKLPDRTQVFIGTEYNLVQRLKSEHARLRIEPLFRSLCPTMYMVDLKKVLHCLESLDRWEPVLMSQELKAPARLALERMLALKGPVKA